MRAFLQAVNLGASRSNSVLPQLAYVINLPSSTERWAAVQHTVAALPGLVAVQWPAVPLDDPRIQDAAPSPPCVARSLSLLLSFFDAWQHFAELVDASAGNATAEDEWALFLEDDAEWHPSLQGRPTAIQARPPPLAALVG